MVNISHSTQEVFKTYLLSLNGNLPFWPSHRTHFFPSTKVFDRKDELNENGDDRRMSQGFEEPNTKFKSLLLTGSKRTGRICSWCWCLSPWVSFWHKKQSFPETLWYRLLGLKSLCLFQCLCLPDSLNLLPYWHLNILLWSVNTVLLLKQSPECTLSQVDLYPSFLRLSMGSVEILSLEMLGLLIFLFLLCRPKAGRGRK